MRELLTKDGCWYRPSVIKKAAAIFLLITLMIIGGIPQALAQTSGTSGMIAATQSVDVLSPNAHVRELFKLPIAEPAKVPFNVPTLDGDALATLTWKPEAILGEPDSQAASRTPSITGIITSAFGYRKHPVRGRVRHHNGIDLAAKLGAPVLAPAAGVVTFSGVKRGYGNVVEIDHENGYTTLLAHNSRLLVSAGDIVKAGMVIAKAGSTGISTGVHVHVEVRKYGSLVNPVAYLAK